MSLFRQGSQYIAIGLLQLLLDWLVFVAATAVGLPAAPGNLLGRVGSGPLVVALDGHLDTVGVGDPSTWARDPYRGELKDGVIYVGPMGCRTGFYLLTRGLTPAQALALTVDSFRFMAAFEGDIPGASEVECGNYRDMDLPAARAEAAAMLPVLEALTADQLHY